MRAICSICNEVYAEVNLLESPKGEPVGYPATPLRYPVTGAMFGSPDFFHGFPAPFDPSLDWEAMRCPYGRTHRPFVQPDLVKTNKGMVRLPRDGSPAFLDPSAPSEVGRESISDRVMQVSDEEAERLVRDEMTTKVFASDNVVAEVDEVARWNISSVATGKPEPQEVTPKIIPGFQCPECGKVFDTKQKVASHARMAHKGKK